MSKFEVIKTTVIAKSRKLTATWTLDSSDIDFSPKRKKPETREEEAEEIMYRLRNPPIKKSLGEVISEELAKSIAEEIDKEILECLKNNQST